MKSNFYLANFVGRSRKKEIKINSKKNPNWKKLENEIFTIKLNKWYKKASRLMRNHFSV